MAFLSVFEPNWSQAFRKGNTTNEVRGETVNCGACGEAIPADSMFCPECGARQDTSMAGGFTPPPQQNIPPFPQQQRTFDPVSGQQQRMQQQTNMNQMGQVPPDMLQGMAQGLQQHQNLPPGQYPQQPVQGGFPPQQGFPPQSNVMPTSNVAPMNDMPNVNRGPSLASGAVPTQNNVAPVSAGGTKIAHNPANSPTDAMVNRLAEAERAVKEDRRSQWLSMNQSPASSVLANLGGGELPSHLRAGNVDGGNAAADIMAGALSGQGKDAPNDALLRRISEVAIRRVARKRGVAVEAPQTKLVDDTFEVNVTYVDDGRVLDSPEDLTQAFEQAIQTELALKGYDLSCSITMFRSKDGKTEKIGEEAADEDMFACEICDGLVKESDPTCPHCGAMFEDDGEDEAKPSPHKRGGGPPGPKKGGPPGPKKGGPPGPKKGGPPGPKKSGGPPGPKKGGPPGPSKSGGPPKGGPGGGPPGPKKGGPPGPSKSGGPPKGGPGGGPPGPKKSGPPGGPKRGPPR
jgi:RNA polymerase subunit RPABC4/transcription elongation factor Spt4